LCWIGWYSRTMKKIFVMLALTFSIFNPGLSLSGVATAAGIDCSRTDLTAKQQVECGACDAANAAGTDCQPDSATGSLSNTIKEVINVISVLAGAAAVVMIIIGGFRYITSAGNAEGAKAAKNTILYAIIGLVVIALAQIIVHFTLNTVSATCINGKTSSGQKCTP